jgi:hypothetical protein
MTTVQEQPLIIFLHLPKTAGSTLARIIERQYKASAILHLYPSSFGEELVAIPQNRMELVRIVMGHLYFGAHAFLSQPCTYLTMLRDPVDRVISHYNYVRHQPSHYLYEEACRMSLRDYVEFCGRQEPNNDQTRLLAGGCNVPNFGQCSEEMLNIAKRNLADHFAVVGLTEEFDRSLIIMKRAFKWRDPFYISENVGQVRARKEKIPRDTLRVVENHNALDIELYRYAKDVFQEQVRMQGDSLDHEIRRFRALNTFYGQLQVYASYAISQLRKRYLRFGQEKSLDPL